MGGRRWTEGGGRKEGRAGQITNQFSLERSGNQQATVIFREKGAGSLRSPAWNHSTWRQSPQSLHPVWRAGTQHEPGPSCGPPPRTSGTENRAYFLNSSPQVSKHPFPKRRGDKGHGYSQEKDEHENKGDNGGRYDRVYPAVLGRGFGK